jgi:DNA invertase Pin-like site-specific DNA recombinase
MARRVSSNWVTGMNDYNLQKIRFKSADVQSIHQAKEKGLSYAEIAQNKRCSTFTVWRVLNYQGVYRQYRGQAIAQ